MFRTKEKDHKPLILEEFKVMNFTWPQLIKQLTKSSLHHNTFNILEAVFFHPIFSNRPQGLCSQNSGNGIIMQDISDLSVADVIRGCALLVNSQSDEDGWSSDPVSLVIKDGKYRELDLLSLTRIPRLFPSGVTAIVFTKVAKKLMKSGVFVHEIKRGVEIEKDEVKCEGNDKKFNESRLKEYTWGLVKVIETQTQGKCVHFLVLYKLAEGTEEPFIAYVLKCLLRSVATMKSSASRDPSPNAPPPLTAYMQARSLWSMHSSMKLLRPSLRSYIINPATDSILGPKDFPVPEGIHHNRSRTDFNLTTIAKQKKRETEQRSSSKLTRSKRTNGVYALKKGIVLPMIKPEELVSDFNITLELRGSAFPGRHSRPMDLTFD